MAVGPLAGQRTTQVTERHTRVDWARFVPMLLVTVSPLAKKVVLVMDNLNTHGIASLYEAFAPAVARTFPERLELHDTPKHGSWLNIAETERSVLARQCLDRRIDNRDGMAREVAAWPTAQRKQSPHPLAVQNRRRPNPIETAESGIRRVTQHSRDIPQSIAASLISTSPRCHGQSESYFS